VALLRCRACGRYTLSPTCPACGGPTARPGPARYSPEDRYGRYRRALKHAPARASGGGAAAEAAGTGQEQEQEHEEGAQ